MLVADIAFLASSSSDTQQNATLALILGVMSGLTAVIVAFIGYLGVKSRNAAAAHAAQSAAPAGTREPPYVREMRKDLAHARAVNELHDQEINRLEQLLIINLINPKDGSHLGEAS